MSNDSVQRVPLSFEDFLQQYGFLAYTVCGISMMPLLRQKIDVVDIRPKGEERCKKYDVVLYKYDMNGSKYILHRILKVRPNDYVIAGDHNTFLEYGITDQQIIGVMTRIRRNGKEITMDNKLYRMYVHLWCDCYPVRMWIIKSKNKVRGFLSKVKHRFVK